MRNMLQNYHAPMMLMGLIHGKPSKVSHCVVRHDDWCGFLKGGDCNCNPVLEHHDKLPEEFKPKKKKNRRTRRKG